MVLSKSKEELTGCCWFNRRKIEAKKDTAVQALPPYLVSFELTCSGFCIPCRQSSQELRAEANGFHHNGDENSIYLFKMLSRETLENDALSSRLFIQFDEISLFPYGCIYTDNAVKL